MAKRKRLVRLFFNTFYEDAYKAVVEALEREYGRVRVVKSRVLPEFYYVEVHMTPSDDLEEASRRIEELVRSVGGDRVFGVRAYPVET